MTTFGWYVGIVAALLAVLVYLAYFFKFNWVRVSLERRLSRTRRKTSVHCARFACYNHGTDINLRSVSR